VNSKKKSSERGTWGNTPRENKRKVKRVERQKTPGGKGGRGLISLAKKKRPGEEASRVLEGGNSKGKGENRVSVSLERRLCRKPTGPLKKKGKRKPSAGEKGDIG